MSWFYVIFTSLTNFSQKWNWKKTKTKMLRFNILIFNFRLESCAATSRGSRPTLLLMLWFLSRKVAMTTCKLARMRVWDDRKILWARETQPLSDAHLERDQNKYEGLCYPNGLMTTTCQQVWAGTSSPLSLGCNCKPGGGRGAPIPIFWSSLNTFLDCFPTLPLYNPSI